MTDFEKYKDDILRLKRFYVNEYGLILSDEEALKIIKETNEQALKGGKK